MKILEIVEILEILEVLEILESLTLKCSVLVLIKCLPGKNDSLLEARLLRLSRA